MTEINTASGATEQLNRRTFTGRMAFWAMAGGLAASYGTFALFAGRYLFPAGAAPRRWMFVADLKGLGPTASLAYTAPDGARINIARLAQTGAVDDFIALSSTCPHLGCQVHWEPQNNRFFCPCHNGIFDPLGKGTGGPPGDAKQSLPRYRLKIENGLLYIKVPDAKLGGRNQPYEAPPSARV
jgi:nitrite reductase/ring-hydroxylating ferredoxin subunit